MTCYLPLFQWKNPQVGKISEPRYLWYLSQFRSIYLYNHNPQQKLSH